MKKKIKYSVEDLKKTSANDFSELLEKYDVIIYMLTPRRTEKIICMAVYECDQWKEGMRSDWFTNFSRGSKAVYINELDRSKAIRLNGVHSKKIGFIIPYN